MTAPTVLIVDDDQDIREIAAMVLSMEGYAAVTASDGVRAVEQLRTGVRPALILLDLRMPRLDGAGFLTQSRQEGLINGTPVVVLSGEIGAQEECDTLHLPLLMKPVDMEDLLEAVHRLAPL